MTGQRSNQRNSSSWKTKERRCRAVGLGAGAGVFLTFGLAPLVTAPAAHADDLDLLLDPIINWFSSISPALGTDLSGLASNVDPTFSGDHSADATDSLDSSTPPDFAQLIDQYIYTPLHAGIEDWLGSSTGHEVAGFINTVLGSYAIGDGTAGTEADPGGGAGGWLLGDGGAGYDSTEVGAVGGDGGAAGFFGNGGAGGDGGAGAAGGDGGTGGSFMGIGGVGGDGGAGVDGAVGGHGGDGGDAGGALGSGGDGGSAGDGGAAGTVPALGGAGGNAGVLGEHGSVGAAGTLTSGPPVGVAHLISTTGTSFTDSDGRVVILHGLNEVNIVSPLVSPADAGFGDDDAAFLAANGFSSVRVGVDWSLVEPQPGVFDDTYLASVEQTVQTLANHGIVSLLDFHQQLGPSWAIDTGGIPSANLPFPLSVFFDPANNHALDQFWSNAPDLEGYGGLENDYAEMVAHVANAFNGNPNVLGIEIMNEPEPGNQFWPSVFGSSYFGAEQLTPFYDRVASAIRAVDPSTPIFYEPSVLATAMAPIHLGTVDDSNTVLSFHDYCFVNLGPLGCLPFVDTIADNALAYAQAHNIPAMMTEFGSSSNQSSIINTMQPADQALVSWTEWVYGGPQQSGVGIDGTPASLVNDPSQPPVGDNVNTANLETLAQPYPQAVAGTPNPWSFENGIFQFSYSTAHVDGSGNFAAGSQTTISTPAVEFPNGYQVSVTGGHVVSAANAPQLIIASDGGATTVNITVTAAAA